MLLNQIQHIKSFENDMLDIYAYNESIYLNKFQIISTNFRLELCYVTLDHSFL